MEPSSKPPRTGVEAPEQTPKERRRREEGKRKKRCSRRLRAQGLEKVVTIMGMVLVGKDRFVGVVEGSLKDC